MRVPPVRTGVVGYGLSGRVFHAPLVWADPQFSLDVVATANSSRAEAAAGRYPGTAVVPDADAVLALADSLDLVVLGTPPATHYPLAKAALEAGLDVVVDKPFTVTSAQGQELVDLAQRLGRVLTVYQNRRWDNGVLTVKKLLDTGALGEVFRFEAALERWAPDITKAWKAAATTADGGGVMFDLGTHLLDMAVELFGPARVVHAEINTRRVQERADDDNFVVLRHAAVDGRAPVTSHLTMNALSSVPGPHLRVLGTKAGYIKHRTDPQEQQLESGMLPTADGYGLEPPAHSGLLGVGDDVEQVPSEPGCYPEFYRILGRKLTGGGMASQLPLPVDPRGPVAVLRLIEQARDLAAAGTGTI